MPAAEYALAFSAGLISFASPCVLPLVPVYLSVTSGLAVSEMSEPSRRVTAAVTRGASLFIVGFSLVFVGLGLSATAIGGQLLRHQVPITRLAGLLVVAMALVMLIASTPRGLLLSREWRFLPQPSRRRGLWAAPVVGAAFAFGWTPCIGPVLGSVLVIAAGQGGVLRGAALLSTYAAGLAVPLLLVALAFHRAIGPMRWTRRHSLGLTRAMATVLLGYGLLLFFDRLSWLTQTLQSQLTATG